MTIAVVLFAHDKSSLLRRLVGALGGLPVFLHVGTGVPQQIHDKLAGVLLGRVRLLSRISSGWTTSGLVEAELAGYRVACATADAQRIVMVAGADYPLVHVERLVGQLARARGRSWARMRRLSVRHWDPVGGYDRFVFSSRAKGRRRIWSLILRRWPKGIRPVDDSQLKILTRHYAELILKIVDPQPDLADYFRVTWVPDETMIPNLLASPAFDAR